ncbi:hypothetical protein PHABIO_410 [Pseudomonas phage Phabio]|uniref:Uncharacterized protein n=1 Tax=Pseudomonas phage Phabio TaxID=2006668 RepID=A0A1Y0SU53_9CAUD|nr:hypothetical protein MZD05_gp410 [Pseudomonas phage Phabio]ARV77041.1 hypothetical protein PHABIO_410 [Pseudomonas phage Phabio]
MYSLNYAGVVFSKSYNEVVRDLIADNKWSEAEPFHFKLNNADQEVSSVVSRSVDSMELSGLITLLHDNGVPHRLFTIPKYEARVLESFAARGERLVVHHRPRDMMYQLDYPSEGESARLFGLANAFKAAFNMDPWVPIKSIVVVGPHCEARKLYRWLDWSLRDNKVLGHYEYHGLNERLKMGKVYIQTHENVWHVFASDCVYVGEVTGVLDAECFVANINGFSQHGVVYEDPNDETA